MTDPISSMKSLLGKCQTGTVWDISGSYETRKSDGPGNANPEANDAALLARLGPSLQKLLGAENFITNLAPMMGSEDFQELYQGRNTPYALMWVGVAPKELFEKARSEGQQFPYINHTPDFFVDLAAIPMGARINTTAVMNIMAHRHA